MLYNVKLKKVQYLTDCYGCDLFDTRFKKCKGLNKRCFAYDETTGTCFDGVTKLPIKIDEISKEN